MKLSLAIASTKDAAEITALLSEAAQNLTACYGKGHWSYAITEKGVLHRMSGNSKVLIVKCDGMISGTLTLTTKKPWSIDVAYFTKVPRPVYLIDMAVHPDMQRKGIGRFMIREVKSFVIAWADQSIRLDAYDSEAGAGEFYRKCGFSEKGHVVYRNVPLIYFELLI